MPLRASQLEVLILAQERSAGAPWPPPPSLQADVEGLIAADLLEVADGRVLITSAGAAALETDVERAPILQAELAQAVDAGA